MKTGFIDMLLVDKSITEEEVQLNENFDLQEDLFEDDAELDALLEDEFSDEELDALLEDEDFLQDDLFENDEDFDADQSYVELLESQKQEKKQLVKQQAAQQKQAKSAQQKKQVAAQQKKQQKDMAEKHVAQQQKVQQKQQVKLNESIRSKYIGR